MSIQIGFRLTSPNHQPDRRDALGSWWKNTTKGEQDRSGVETKCTGAVKSKEATDNSRVLNQISLTVSGDNDRALHRHMRRLKRVEVFGSAVVGVDKGSCHVSRRGVTAAKREDDKRGRGCCCYTDSSPGGFVFGIRRVPI